jgi:hypothetical protein
MVKGRRWGSVAVLALVCMAVVAMFTPTALAATPQQIYDDIAAHGKLTQHYSTSDLQAALRNATVQGYVKPTVPQTIKKALGGQGASKTTSPSGSTLPFTGLDLGLIVGGGVGLLLIGFGMRRVGRAKS